MKTRFYLFCLLLAVWPMTKTRAAALPSGTTANPRITILATPDSHQGQLTLSWVGDGTAAGFLVERSTDGLNFTQVGQVLAPLSTYRDTGLTVLMPYYYRVRAYNPAGKSPYSAVAVGTVLAAPPAGSALVSWNVVRAPSVPGTVTTCATVQYSSNLIQFTDLPGCMQCSNKNFSLGVVGPTTNRAGFYRLKLSES